jgi:negative regulator of flagellin synthesis FlgM
MSINRVNQQVIREYTARVQPAQTQPNSTQSAPKAEEAASQPTRQPDEIRLSIGGPQLQKLREAVNAAPDVREDRVAEIKRQLSEGTYQVDYSALAKKLAGIINFE